MQSSDPMGLRGEVSIQIFRKDGSLKEDVLIKNLVVNAGLAWISSRMLDASSAVVSHMGLGTSSTAAAATQTALVAEAGTRAAVTAAARVTTTVTNDSVQYVATFDANNPAGLTAITEAGLFNALTGGTMIARTVFPVINKDVDDSLAITWKIINTAL